MFVKYMLHLDGTVCALASPSISFGDLRLTSLVEIL